MVEITEVLRLWRDGVPKKRIAAPGLDPKTVRRYVAVAESTGLRTDAARTIDTCVGHDRDRWELRLDGRHLMDHGDPIAKSEVGDGQ